MQVDIDAVFKKLQKQEVDQLASYKAQPKR